MLGWDRIIKGQILVINRLALLFLCMLFLTGFGPIDYFFNMKKCSEYKNNYGKDNDLISHYIYPNIYYDMPKEEFIDFYKKRTGDQSPMKVYIIQEKGNKFYLGDNDDHCVCIVIFKNKNLKKAMYFDIGEGSAGWKEWPISLTKLVALKFKGIEINWKKLGDILSESGYEESSLGYTLEGNEFQLEENRKGNEITIEIRSGYYFEAKNGLRYPVRKTNQQIIWLKKNVDEIASILINKFGCEKIE